MPFSHKNISINFVYRFLQRSWSWELCIFIWLPKGNLLCRRKRSFAPSRCLGRISSWTRQIYCKVNIPMFWYSTNPLPTFFLFTQCNSRPSRVWNKFHNSSSKDASFHFTFPEFVRLVVNGSREFAGDEYMSQVIRFFSPPTYLAYLLHISYLSFSSHISRSTPLQHRLISSHWAAYHEECPPCSQFTSPLLVLTMENLQVGVAEFCTHCSN